MNRNRVALFATAIALSGALSACGPTTDEDAPADDVATSEAPAEESEAPEDESTEAPDDESTEAPDDESTDVPEDESTEAPEDGSTEAPTE